MKNIPWTGIALVVLSIGLTINGFRIAHLQYQISELKLTNNMNIQTDKDIVNVIKQVQYNQENMLKLINLMQSTSQSASPTDCLKTHKLLINNYLDMQKNYLELILKYNKLSNEVKQLRERK